MSTSIKIILSKKPVRFGIAALLGLVIIFVVASWILYTRTLVLLTENLRERLLTISITAAATIDARHLDALRGEEDWEKPEWAMVVNRLHKAKYSNKDIVFMYIFRKQKDDPANMEFVADADSIDPYANTSGDPSRYIDVNRDGTIEPDGPDKLQWPGQEYPEARDIPETFAAYEGPLTSKDLYTDAYGTVLTGYAPIRDESGNTVAVLATDIKADDFFTITRQTLYPFLIFILFLVVVIIIFNILLLRGVIREVEQREQLEKLTKELKSANDQLATANAKLKQLDQAKTEFLSITSHQLRTPLTGIKGYLSMMLEGDFGKFVKEQADVLLRVSAEVDRLARMVQVFLNVSRIESGRLVIGRVETNVVEIAMTVVKELTPLAEKKKLQLSYAGPPKLQAIVDPDKLKDVVMNLVDNSIKYTEAGTIHVKVEGAETFAQVTVEDTGMGIDPEEAGKLFEKFSRGIGVAKVSAEGTGLGLFIVKKIVEAHGGKVWAESKGKGKGSAFIFTVPLKPPEEPA